MSDYHMCHIRDLVTIISGFPFSNDERGIFDIIKFMSDDNSMDDLSIANIIDDVRAELRKQFPEISRIKFSEVLYDINKEDFYDKLIEEFGEYHRINKDEDNIYYHNGGVIHIKNS